MYTGALEGGRKPLARGKGWAEVAVQGEAAWVLRREGARGALLRVPLSGGDPVEEIGLLERPGGLHAGEGRLFWLESPPSMLPGHPHVPAAAVTRLQCREGSGAVRTLASWPSGAPGAPGDVAGVLKNVVYVRHRRGWSTEFLRVPLAGGNPVFLAVEDGLQQGLVWGDSFYRTAPSREMPPDSGHSVLRLGSDGRDEWITDWLPTGGSLLARPDGVYYSGDVFYRLPSRLDAPAVAGSSGYGEVASDGPTLVRTRGVGAPAKIDLGQGGR